MGRRCILCIALAGCLYSESGYEAIARAHLKRGPVEACCYGLDVSSVRKACEDEALVKCGFVQTGELRRTKVARFGHDDGAMVDFDVVTGNVIKGHCSVQVINYQGVSARQSTCSATP